MKLIILAITLIAIIMTFVLPHVSVIRQENRIKNKSSMLYKVKEDKETKIKRIFTKDIGFRNVTIEELKQTTLLHKIVQEGTKEDIKKIIDKGTPINARTKIGHTALHIAAILNRHEIVKFLIDQKADPTIKDDNGDLPVDLIAQIPQNNDIINFLKQEQTNRKF